MSAREAEPLGAPGEGEQPGARAPSLRVAIAITVFATVLLATLVAAALTRWWVQRDVGFLLENIGWRPPASMPGWSMRQRLLGELFQSTGFGDRLRNSIIVSGLIGASLAGLVGFFGAAWVARPLTNLAVRVRRLAAGNFAAGEESRREGVSEVVAISAAVQSLSSQLEAAETLRVRLVEDLVHELRSPLTAVRGYAEGLRDGVFPDQTQAVNGLERELGRIERLLTDLRHSALPSTPGSFVRVDLGELSRAVADGFAARAIERQIELSVAIAAPGLSTNGDPDRLSQLLSNLLDNALKFTPPGGRVSVHVTPAAGREEVALSVEDSGPGIPADDVPHIFDRLYRADGSRARSTGGSGIGLAIAKQIVLNHLGTIEAHNVAGGGARFVVRLPRVRP